ncbi:MAG: prepilin-type N-terminal cleavage/methylation domain-containing protein [candidate division Zixibacteria bacterium]|nr:prepilin-type N-terminal cleavage/methylation domain-containing protein [candidate division Zixibacteria bacterium]
MVVGGAKQRGFTFVEVVLVIVILGIIAAVATSSLESVVDNSRHLEAQQELERLSDAIVGEDKLISGGARTDYGYVGDVGALPANLDNLVTNPGGYTTWNGPYVRDNFNENTDDFKTDPWNTNYVYTGGLTIQSTGSGANITKQFANISADLLSNTVRGVILDRDGAPPGADSVNVTVTLTYPDGVGGLTTTTVTPNSAGSFTISGIPMGNQSIRSVYSTQNDTAETFVSVAPRVGGFVDNLRFGAGYWTETTGGTPGVIEYVAGTGEIKDDLFRLDIKNTGGSNLEISWMVITWDASPTIYAEQVDLGTAIYFFNDCNKLSSGDTVFVSPTNTMAPSPPNLTIKVRDFSDALCGGASADVPDNTDVTVTFSNGDVITLTVVI